MRKLYSAIVLSILIVLGFGQASNADFIISLNPEIDMIPCGVDNKTEEISVVAKKNGLSNLLITFNLPTGIDYVAGSVVKISGPAGITVAESSIVDLNNPVFQVTGTFSVANNLVFEIERTATCSSIAYALGGGSFKDAFSASYTGGTQSPLVDNDLTISPYNVNVAVLGVQTINTVTSNVGESVTNRDVEVVQGGSGCTPIFTHRVFFDPSSITNYELRYQGNLLTPAAYSTVDTLFYEVDLNSAIFSSVGNGDACFDNGETVIFQESFTILKCDPEPVRHSAYYGCSFGEVCQISATQPGGVIYGSELPNVTITGVGNSSTFILCDTNHITYTITNTNTNPGAAALDILINVGAGTNNVNPTTYTNSPLYAHSSRKPASNYKINGNPTPNAVWSSLLPTAGSQYSTSQVVVYNQITTDPDGPGVGLEDLDGDGFYDDLPPGESFTFSYDVMLNPNYSSTCGIAGRTFINYEHMYTQVTHKNQCGVPRPGRTTDLNYSYYGKNYAGVPSDQTAPTDLQPSGTGLDSFMVSVRTQFNRSAFACGGGATERYQVRIPLPTGVYLDPSVGTNLSSSLNPVFFMEGDTLVYEISGTGSAQASRIFEFPLYIDCGAYTGSNRLSLEYITRFICDGCLSVDVECHTLPTINTHCPGPCNGLYTLGFDANRTTPGWTDETRTAKVVLDPNIHNTKYYLTTDTMQILTYAYIKDTTVDNAYLDINYSGVANLEFVDGTIEINDISSGSFSTNISIAPTLSNVSNNKTITFDLSPYQSIVSPTYNYGEGIQADTIWLTLNMYIPNSFSSTVDQPLVNFTSQFYSLDASNAKHGCDIYGEEATVHDPFVYVTQWINNTTFNECNSNAWIRHGLYNRGLAYETLPGEYRPAYNMDSVVFTLPDYIDFIPGTATFSNGWTEANGDVQTIWDASTRTLIVKPAGNFYEPNFGHSFMHATIRVDIKCGAPNSLAAGGAIPIQINWDDYAYNPNAVINNTTNTASGNLYTFNTPLFTIQSPNGTAQGTQSDISWDLQVDKTSNYTTDFNWLRIENQPGINITGIYEVVGATETLLNTTTSSQYTFAEMGGLTGPSVSYYRIKANYNTCDSTAFDVNIGWGCQGYPTDYSSIDENTCYNNSFTLTLEPKTSIVSIEVDTNTVTPVTMCDPFNVEMSVLSSDLANVNDPFIQFNVPGGINGLTIDSVTVEFPANSGDVQLVSTSVLGNSRIINLMDHTAISAIGGLNGTANNSGVNGRQIDVVLYAQTTCDYIANSALKFVINGDQPCGGLAQGSGSSHGFSKKISIAGAVNDYEIFTAITPPTNGIEACSNGQSINFSGIVFSGTGGFTGPSDSMRINIPLEVDYQSFACNSAFCPTFVSNNVVNGTNELKFVLPSGMVNGDAFDFDLFVNTAEGCDTLEQVEMSTYLAITGLMCNASTCGSVLLETGFSTSDISIKKPSFQFTNVTASSLQASVGQEQISIDYSIENVGFLDADSLGVILHYDANANGVIDAGDVEIYRSNLFAVNVPVGSTFSDNITRFVNVPNTCPLILEIDPDLCDCEPDFIVISDIPIIGNAGSDKQVCGNDTVQIGQVGMTGYNYSWSGLMTGASLSDQFVSNPMYYAPSVTVSSVTDEIYLTTFRPSGCVSFDTIVVTINPNPQLVISPSDTTVCIGEYVTFTANPSGMTYDWSNGFSTQSINVFQTGIYEVEITDLNGCKAKENVVLSNYQDVTASITSSNSSMCLNQDPRILTGIPVGGIFSGVGVTSSTAPSGYEFNPAVAGVGSHLISYIYTNLNGCADTAYQSIEVLTIPSVSFTTNDTSICQSSGLLPIFVNPSNATLSGPGNVSTGSFDPNLPNTGPGVYDIIAQVNSANGCSNFDTLTITVTSGPASPTVGSNSSVCEGSTLNLTASTIAGVTYAWTGPSGFTSSMQNPSVSNMNQTKAGTYTVVVTESPGCSSAPASVNVVVDDEVELTAPATATCDANGLNYRVTFTVTGYETFTATGSGAPGTWFGNTFVSGPIPSGTPYSIDVQDSSACNTLTVANASPDCDVCISTVINTSFSKTPATQGSSCTDGTATINPSGGTGPYTFVWSTGDNTQTITDLSPGTYTVEVFDANGCSSGEKSVVITCVNNCDAAIQLYPDSTLATSCNGGNDGQTMVTASSASNPGSTFTFNWTDATGGVVSSTVNDTVSYATGLEAGTYTVSVTIDGLSCAAVQQSITISEPDALSLSGNGTAPTTVIPGNDGSATVLVTGGTPTYTYLWSDPSSQTTATATGLTPGTYTVTVTDANGCQATIAVEVPSIACTSPDLVATISSTNVNCNGGNDGTASVAVSSGQPPYSYTWSNGAPDAPSASGLSAGNISVTVTDGRGCSIILNETVTQPSPLSGGIAVTNVNCNGTTTGALDLTVSGGTQPYSFAWSNGDVTEDLNNLSAGGYSVVVTDANGCTLSLNATINEPASALSVSITKVDAKATNGCADGSATASVSGGTPPYSFSWSDASNQQTATATGLIGSTQGVNYNLIVTDANGCTSTQSVNIGCVNDCDAVIAVDSVYNVSCKGSADGLAEVSASSVANPTASFNFSWSNGFVENNVTTSSLTGVAAGVYTVSVTIAGSACQPVTQSVIVTEPAAVVTVNVTGTDETALGANDGTATANPTGGTPGYTYLWDAAAGNATTQTVTGLAPGNYCVTVTDANGCTAQGCYEVIDYGCTASAPALSYTVQQVNCNGGNDGIITVNVDNPTDVTTPLTYTWVPNVSTTGTATNLSAGNYSVTVSGADGCFSTINPIVVTQPTSLSAGIAVTNVACNGALTGSLDLTVSGGTPPYTYQWGANAGNAISEDLTGLAAGTYSVTITDANGCSVMSNATITEPSNELSVTITKVDALATNGCNDGTATASASGGTPPYSYSWSDAGNQTTATAIGLLGSTSGENYNVVVTDANGCTTTQSVIINCVNNCDAAITIDSVINVSCKGGNDGEATVTASSVANPGALFNFTWSNGVIENGVTTSTLTGVSQGVYTVSVTIAGTACQPVTQSVTITEPNTVVSVNVTGTNETALGANDGTATANPSGGTPGYTYLWDAAAGNATSATVTGLAPGNYCVTVTDDNGCTAQGCYEVINYGCTTSAPEVSYTVQNALCNGDASGTITLNIDNPTEVSNPLTYTWMPNVSTSGTATGLAAGNYSVTVAGNDGCFTTINPIVVTQPSALSSGVAVTHVACNNGTTGSVDLTVSGGVGPYTFSWDNGAATEDITNLSAGTYIVTITDANGCSLMDTAIVDEPSNPLSFTSVVVNDATNDQGCSNGSIEVVVMGGTAPYTYTWSDGSPLPFTTATATGLEGTTTGKTYTVTVTDANGCTISQSEQVECLVVCDAQLAIDSVYDVDCYNGNNGYALASASSNAFPNATFTFEWTQGATTVQITNNDTVSALMNAEAGVYVVSVTIDSTTCNPVQQSVTINQPTNTLVPQAVTIQDQLSVGGFEGEVSGSVTGGTAPYTYNWTGPNSYTGSGQNISSLEPGQYCLVVTDANGCNSAQVCTFVNPWNCVESPNVSFNVDNVSCNGLSDASIITTVNGGNEPYTFEWVGSGVIPTDQNQVGLTAGTYTLTVTDATGCQTQTSVTITEPAAISGGIAVTNVNCFGASTGILNLTVSGGVQPYTFEWSVNTGNAVTEDVTDLPAGNYSVDVTDANGCTETFTASINQPASEISINLAATNASNDQGCNNGVIDATVSGGTAPYTYTWSANAGAQTSASAVGLFGSLTGESYTVIVTDANGCTATGSTIVYCDNVCDAAISIDSVNQIDCNGNTNGAAFVTASSNAFPNATFTFEWTFNSNVVQTTLNDTESSITNVGAGTYIVSVTIDSTTCQPIQQSVNINQPSNPVSVTATTLSDQTTINGTEGQVTANGAGGTPPYTYDWEGPSGFTATGKTISNLLPGQYCVIVTDANGCESAQVCTIVNPYTCPENPTIQFTSANLSCNGAGDGTITANVNGGLAPYTYTWTGIGVVQDTAIQENLEAGTYSLLITDANGCQAQSSITLSQPNAMNGGIAVTNVNCHGASTGSLDLTVSGGTAPYAFQWDANAGNVVTEDVSGLPVGTYNVVVTDANGCTLPLNATISEPANALSLNIYPMAATLSAGCNNGEAYAVVTGGTAPYSYTWSGNASTDSVAVGLFGSVQGETYSLIVTDANGCTFNDSYVIECIDNCDVSVTVDSTSKVSCKGGSDGTISASASSVNNPSGTFTFVWTNDANVTVQTDYNVTSSMANNLPTGIYTVSVTLDSSLCPPVEQNISITEPASTVNANAITLVDQQTVNGTEGTVTVSATGGTAPYSYLWNDPSASTTQTVSGLLPGTYCVTVTDANGCATGLICTTINPYTCVGSDLAATTTVQNVLCNGDETGSITVTTNGGTSPYTYAWNDTSFTGSTFANIPAGSYTVTVTDANGCAVNVTSSINEPSPLSAGLAVSNESCPGLNDGSIDLTVNGGVGPYTYDWDHITGGANQQDLTGIGAGNYCVDVIDANGCTITQCDSVNSTPPSSIGAITIVMHPDCGLDNGSIEISGLPASTPFTLNYTIGFIPQPSVTITSNGSGVFVLSNLAPGSYNNFTVTNDNTGCESAPFNGPFVLLEGDLPQIDSNNVTLTPPTTCSSCDGSIFINGLDTLVDYEIDYFYNGVPVTPSPSIAIQSSSNGTVLIAGLCAGAYNNIVITDVNSGCSYNAIPVNGGPYEILNPNAAVIANNGVKETDPSDCGTCDGEIAITLDPTSLGTPNYTISYSFNGGPTQTVAGLSTNGSNELFLTGLCEGSYTDITIEDASGCLSPVQIGPYVLEEPENLNVGTASTQNPTTCSSCDGNITIDSLLPNTAYTLSYTDPMGVDVIGVPLTSNPAGEIQLTGLCQGTYSALVVTNPATMCSSDTIPGGPFTLEAPNSPEIVPGGVLSTNPTNCGLCDGQIAIELDAASLGTATYEVSYSLNGGATQSVAGLTLNSSNELVLTGLCGGSYTNIIVEDANTCTSANQAGPFVLVTPTELAIGTATGQNPSTCNVCDGNISVNGLDPNTNYSVSYIDPSGTLVPSVSLTSSATGIVQLTNLCDGTYSQITVTDPSTLCASDTLAPVTLTDPNVPMPTGITNITDPSACLTDDGLFTITGLTPGTYTVQYELDNVAQTSPAITVGSAGNLTLNNLSDGTYDNIEVITATGCRSAALGPITLFDPTPVLGSAGVDDTICLGESYTLTATINALGTNVTWRYMSGVFINTTSPVGFTQVITPNNTANYEAEFENTNTGCVYNDTVQIFVEKAPYLTADGCFTTDEDVAYVGNIATELSANDDYIDVLSGDVTFTTVDVNEGTLTFNNAAGTFTYTPSQNYAGQDTATVQVCNTACPTLCNETTICFTVLPVTETITITTPEDTPIEICTPDISDLGTGTTITECGAPSDGMLNTPTTDSCVTYTPNMNYVGDDMACIVACNNGVCDTTILDITVTPVTDTLPITVDEDGNVTVCVPEITDMAPGATITSCEDPEHGQMTTPTTDTCITYAPDLNYVGEDTACIVTCNNGVCDTTILTITVNPVNDYINVEVLEDDSITICPPLITDMGGNGTVDVVVLPENGSLNTPTTDECVTYTPNPNYVGDDSTVIVTCFNGICDTTYISIVVNPVTDTLQVVVNEDEFVEICAPAITDMGGNGTITDCDAPDNGTINTPSTNGCITYTPNTNYVGEDEACIVTCYNGVCDTTILEITVLPVTDTIPLVVEEDSSVTVCVPVITDMGGNGTITECDAPDNGTQTIVNTLGCVTYEPNTNYVGDDEACIVTCLNGVCDTTYFTITVTPVTDTVEVSTEEDDSVTVCVPVLTDMGGNGTITECDAPDNGTTTIDNTTGCVTYVPNTNFVGNDTTCLVTCFNGVCDTTQLVVTVTPVTDTLPIVVDEDDSVTICVPVITDMGGNGTITECDAPDNGTVVIDNTTGCVTYIPNMNYVGDDEACLVTCFNGVCDTTILDITVLPVTDTLITTTPEDTPITICVPDITDMGPGATFETCDGDTIVDNGYVAIDSANGCLTYTPFTNFNGIDTICLIVCNNGICDTTQIVIEVTPVNDPPVAVNDINNTLEDTPVDGDVSTNDSDVDGDNLTFTVLDDVDPTEGTLTLNPDGTYTFEPEEEITGDVIFTYVVCDDGNPVLCDTAEVTITVIPNDPYVDNNNPTANDDNIVTEGDDPIEVCAICNDFDVDGDDITVTDIINPDGYDVVDNGDGTFTVTPPAGVEDTTITFTYVICDDGNPALCDTAEVTIDVNPESNTGIHPPFAVDDATTSNGSPVVVDVLENDLNPDGGPLTVTVVDQPDNGTLTQNPDGTFTYTPDSGYEGPDQFVYEICDTLGNCSQATVYITTVSDNDPPLAVNDVNHTMNDLPVDGDVSTNDSDPNNDPLTFTLVDDIPIDEGMLEFYSDGTYTYTPEPGFEGTTSFTYVVCDSSGLCDTAVVVIDVDQYDPNNNNNPVAVDDNVVTYGDATNPPSIEICAICNDSDPDGDNTTVTVVPGSGPQNGTLVDNGDGTFTYTPDPGFTGEDTWTYVLCDDGNPVLCDTATVTVDVLYNADPNENHGPFATDDYYTVNQDDVLNTENVTDNDFDVDGDDISVSVVDEPENGTLVQSQDGTFEYVPNEGFAGEDQYTYVICDNGSPVLCDTATVYITVLPDDVIAIDDEEFVTNNDPIDIEILTNDTFTTGEPNIAITVEPSLGSVVINGDGTVTYYPEFDNANLVDSFQYVLCVNTICDTAWVVISTDENLNIPDGISPNGDGVNDYFIIDNLTDFFPNATLVIYNRWGDEVWNSFGPYNNNWNGTNLQNVDLPDGTYFYILDYRSGEREPKQGFVAIYRSK